MNLGDMTWLPRLPEKYLKPASSPSAAPGEEATKANPVKNPNKNAKFDEFKEAIARTKLNDAIRRVGDPPKVTRGGKKVQGCGSYHLRGMCFSNCARKHDHVPHSEAEDAELYEWCKLAFE